ncbi:DivIVA domain-containing protein [Granulicatella seriolae]|uniref:DivIVA domain-containing protein n=1 Tax=Granulicatella seriolae TaxID=2967226 RepID=A0ABT1WNL0_9LACT|nr:DivIVA domain-containing protein [Granulicatella seriolae]
MTITPIDIHNKEFPTKFKGYDPELVNDYLDEIIRSMEQLIRDNKDLEKRAKFNEEKVEYFNKIQETLNKSIIVAQEAADRLKENAQKDAEIILFEAEKTADSILKTAAEKANQINRETDSLKKETRVFRQRLQIMVESQLEMIKNEEWDTLLNSPSEVEISIPSIDTISRNRAVKAEETVDVVEQSDVIEGESNPSL